MNNVTERRRSVDSFDRAFPENIQDNSSQDEEEDDDDDEDDQESELDIMGDSSQESDQEGHQRQPYSTSSNLFEFHFEFGSKRPPTTTFIPSEDEQNSDREDQDEDQSDHEWEKEGKSRYPVSLILQLSSLTFLLFFSFYVMEDTKQFPSATDEALQVYENISANIYIGSATGRSMAEESMPCECKYDSELDNPSEACGDDNICINRMMFMECIVQDCPCGRLCQNRRFQLGQYAPVDVIKTEKKGFGLRALADLPSNCFIMEYIGEVIPQTEFIRRTREYDAEGFKHYYFMTLKNDEIIDATKRGCLARFMNHSCNPNCVTQKWVIGKKMRIGIFTSRPIKAGEELTFDYKFERYGAIAQKCYCGEPRCKGFIGASDEKVIEEVLTDTYLNTSDSDSSSDEDDDDDDLDVITIQRPQPLQDPEKVQSFVKRMLNSVGKPRLVNKLLMRLKMTNVDNSHGREILKMIVRLHGLKMLKFWLGEWKNNETIVLKALQVLEKLPLANRNGLEDCKLFHVVHKFINHENEEISGLSQYLLDEWSDLKCVYRIPKRAHVELIQPAIDEEDILEEQMDITTKKITTLSKKKKKKTRYESSREFFDPDNDYFEYVSIDATQEEITFKMRYPPQSLIPTAPKAMLDPSTSTIQFYTEYYQDPYNYSQFYYEAAAAAEGMTLQEYYYAFQQQTLKLPLNWQMAVTNDGSVYYYNISTQQTQWEIPIEDQPQQISIEGVADPLQLEGLVEQAILDSEEIKRKRLLLDDHSSTESPKDEVSTSGSIDENVSFLNDVDLKREVGKIVTKYLSSKKQALWKGDKHLFKELARKVTHHIVDKETQSDRKIKAMDTPLRIKIEKFIDTYGTDYVAKLTQSKLSISSSSSPSTR
ncbi:uncharacterized protein EV154DRAFT_431239 [Mucor mucedo]|uniref:uncharacterized protein n=1 Tax=Mucor mucedo TaxID=29922 RepID=UPI00221E9BF8|nr:uncharacterized protein EV154DRAFT_431239 [Mucor mucedo]KAI7873100.1 hypothetical protein EV154DRAFT_431239 [Mucor mucedo]